MHPLPGEAYTSPATAPAGLVLASEIHVNLREIFTSTEHNHVNTRQLRHLQPFRTGTFVFQNGWLGRVESWLDELEIRFSDGAKCKVCVHASLRSRAQPTTTSTSFWPVSNSNIHCRV